MQGLESQRSSVLSARSGANFLNDREANQEQGIRNQEIGTSELGVIESLERWGPEPTGKLVWIQG